MSKLEGEREPVTSDFLLFLRFGWSAVRNTSGLLLDLVRP